MKVALEMDQLDLRDPRAAPDTFSVLSPFLQGISTVSNPPYAVSTGKNCKREAVICTVHNYTFYDHKHYRPLVNANSYRFA